MAQQHASYNIRLLQSRTDRDGPRTAAAVTVTTHAVARAVNASQRASASGRVPQRQRRPVLAARGVWATSAPPHRPDATPPSCHRSRRRVDRRVDRRAGAGGAGPGAASLPRRAGGRGVFCGPGPRKGGDSQPPLRFWLQHPRLDSAGQAGGAGYIWRTAPPAYGQRRVPNY